ncbi:hypothetical protein Bca4012_021520 [Brassica carinata]
MERRGDRIPDLVLVLLRSIFGNREPFNRGGGSRFDHVKNAFTGVFIQIHKIVTKRSVDGSNRGGGSLFKRSCSRPTVLLVLNFCNSRLMW